MTLRNEPTEQKPKKKGIIRIHDPFEGRTNPISDKYYILTRTNDDNIARGLQPDPDTQEEILDIIDQPDFKELSKKEESLLWRYRYPIKKDKRYRKGVVKFLRSVDWESEKEANEAIEMLHDWEFDTEQAMPMLSVLFSANDIYKRGIALDRCVDIRRRAIEVLEQEAIDTLQRIMLQLAQAYRYEDFEQNLLKDFFLSKVTDNESIIHTFYWIIKLEKDNLGNDERIRSQFGYLFDAFMQKIENEKPEQKAILDRQQEFREKLHEISEYLQKFAGYDNKKNRLREAVGEGGKYEMLEFEPTPMPLEPKIYV